MDVDRSKLYVGKDKDWRKAFWDGHTKQFFGRTATSWCKIAVFYVIFYACLAVFFAGMMAAFYQTLDTEYMPKYTPGDGSSILRNPALGVRPLPGEIYHDSNAIQYTRGYSDMWHWIESLNHFIMPYESYGGYLSGQHLVECSETQYPYEDEVCRFEDTWLGPTCNNAENWGYERATPCIILKMNRMIHWEPVVYESVEELPYDMPEDLKLHIEETFHINDGVMPKMIWVSCKGLNSSDEDSMGPISYYPWQGFPAYYFPFRNTPGYLSPLVSVQFNSPAQNVLINIECRAWAKNIVFDRQNRLGLVQFQLLIE